MKYLLLTALIVTRALAQNKRNIQFTANVYKKLRKTESGSFLASPLSANIILALARLGAEGKTAKEMSETLKLPEKSEKIEKHMRKSLSHLQSGKDYQLKTANKLYIKDGFSIKGKFKKTAVNVFKAEIQNINFENTKKAAKEINNWVEEHTDHKIKDMVSEDSLDDSLHILLINAMYFHGNWLTPFNKQKTQKGDFFVNNKTKTKIDMMEMTSDFNYYFDSVHLVKYLEIPYKGNDVTITFVLPNAIEDLSALEERIADVFTGASYYSTTVKVTIPKFKIETEIKLIPVLRSLGMTNAFAGSADFSGITDMGGLHISEVIQKTYIEVDEEGTTAAAASSASSSSRTPKPFKADHPFVFYIKSKAGVIFVGRYTGNNNKGSSRSAEFSNLKENHECL